jgi:hypothetical protein
MPKHLYVEPFPTQKHELPAVADPADNMTAIKTPIIILFIASPLYIVILCLPLNEELSILLGFQIVSSCTLWLSGRQHLTLTQKGEREPASCNGGFRLKLKSANGALRPLDHHRWISKLTDFKSESVWGGILPAHAWQSKAQHNKRWCCCGNLFGKAWDG